MSTGRVPKILERLPRELSKMTSEQRESYIGWLSELGLKELRRRQNIVRSQQKSLHEQYLRQGKHLKDFQEIGGENLNVLDNLLMEAVDRISFKRNKMNSKRNPPEDIRPLVQHEIRTIGKKGPRINQPGELASFLRPYLAGADREYVLVAILNNKNVVLAVDVTSKGILNASLIHPREIFKAAIVKSAAAIILAHNHPSGDPEPSLEDRGSFDRIVKAGETIGIRCIDMLVLGEDRFFSMYSNESGSYS